MSERQRITAAILLMLTAMTLIVAPVFRKGKETGYSLTGSGRPFRMPTVQESRGTISVNDGDEEDLCRLKGVGETLAALIILERETNGPFYYPEDLISVKGIGMKKLSQFRDDIDY